MTNRLTWHLEKHQLYNKDQAGFRKNKMTIDQVMRLQNDIINGMNNKEYTVAIFLDMKKAFDMVWTTGILEKIHRIGIGGKIYQWIKDFLSGRTFQVRIGDKLSDRYKQSNGTPQGSVISPVLFLMAINDFPDGGTNIKKSIFADDAAIWKTGRHLETIRKQLQDTMTKIETWWLEWGFSLSTEKTVGVVFWETNKPDQISIKLNKQEIKFEKQAKFLGMIMDQRLTWKPHVEYIKSKCQRTLNLMRCLSGQHWGADKICLLTIYRTFIRSRLDYGSIAIQSASDSIKKKMDKNPSSSPPNLLRGDRRNSYSSTPGGMWGDAPGIKKAKIKV